MPMTFNFTSLQLLSLHFVAYFKGVTRFSSVPLRFVYMLRLLTYLFRVLTTNDTPSVTYTRL